MLVCVCTLLQMKKSNLQQREGKQGILATRSPIQSWMIPASIQILWCYLFLFQLWKSINDDAKENSKTNCGDNYKERDIKDGSRDVGREEKYQSFVSEGGNVCILRRDTWCRHTSQYWPVKGTVSQCHGHVSYPFLMSLIAASVVLITTLVPYFPSKAQLVINSIVGC